MYNARSRWEKLIAYIDEHLEESLTTELLCKITHFSAFHFHRQFHAVFGINLAQYIKCVRFKQAANLLIFRKNLSITDIALTVGFDHLEVFSRSFKRWSGLTPSAFRGQPPWEFIHHHNKNLITLRSPYMLKNPSEYTVELITLAPIQLAVLAHKGAPQLLGYSLQKFIQWRKQNGLPPDKARTFNIIYCADDIEPKEDFRCDLAVEYPQTQRLENPQMQRGEIAGGLYARIIHQGEDEGLEPAVRYLYGDWLNANAYELRDTALFFERRTFYPMVPMHERETHIYLPLKDK